jgi:DNA-directed RNA polymerase subunit RPC12/RpoP
MTNSDAQNHLACSLGPPEWEYQCLDCGNEFKMQAAKGPSEEKNRRCPSCDSQNIERKNVVKSEACPPGG